MGSGDTDVTVGVAASFIVTSQLPVHSDSLVAPSLVCVVTETTVAPGAERVTQTTSVEAETNKDGLDEQII